MAIFLDSAMPEEAAQAVALGFVHGITTNPVLLQRAQRPAAEVLRELCRICPGTVFYQLTSASAEGRRQEAERFLQLWEEWRDTLPKETALAAPEQGRLGLKMPATTENMALVAEFTGRGVEVAVTAMFNLSQAYAACEAGATYLLPYVNRQSRLRGDGICFVRQLREVCLAVDRGTGILAASIKSPQEAVRALLAGAQHVSAPLAVLMDMGHDPLSVKAIADFGLTACSQEPPSS
jgi:transaldolase